MKSNVGKAKPLFYTREGKESDVDCERKLSEYEALLPYAQGSEELTAQLYQSSRIYMIIPLLGSTLARLTLGLLITRSITRPLNQAVNVAQAVAAGDLTSQIEVSSKDETGRLLQALKDINSSLQRIVGKVRGDAETIATASNQIAAGNLDLSSRTEELASSLEETASSMEELTSTVKQNAKNARQANGLAMSASEVALNGGGVVSQVVDTMGSINESARKIADIIGVVDSIAFQICSNRRTIGTRSDPRERPC
jgi:methyl-accepting chemotaxis protein